MRKKDKRSIKMETREDNLKIKKRKLDVFDINDSVPPKNTTDHKKRVKNKKQSTAITPVIDELCKADLKGDDKNETVNFSDLEVKIKTKIKKGKSNDVEHNNVELPIVKQSKANKVNETGTQAKFKNKKIFFDDGGGSQESTTENKNSKLKFLNKDEAEVKDDDIDKFCDEITDEDNKTYENWVRLFEANFSKGKK